jgi:hypothetical protein
MAQVRRRVVACKIEWHEIANEKGELIPGVVAICGECGWEQESFGTEGPSIRRCLALLYETCRYNRKDHFYTDNP